MVFSEHISVHVVDRVGMTHHPQCGEPHPIHWGSKWSKRQRKGKFTLSSKAETPRSKLGSLTFELQHLYLTLHFTPYSTALLDHQLPGLLICVWHCRISQLHKSKFSVCLSVCLSIYHLSIYLPIYLPTCHLFIIYHLSSITPYLFFLIYIPVHAISLYVCICLST